MSFPVFTPSQREKGLTNPLPERESHFTFLPDEVILNVLNHLSPDESRRARPVCHRFNNLLGELLCGSVKADSTALKTLADQVIGRFKPPTGSFMGMKITVIQSGSVRPPTALDLQNAQQAASHLSQRFQSF